MASPNTLALQKERLALRAKQVHSTTKTPYAFQVSRHERRKLLRKFCRENGLDYNSIKEEDRFVRQEALANQAERQARALDLLKKAIEASKARGYVPPENASDEALHQHFKAWLTKQAEQNLERERQAAKAQQERTVREAVEAEQVEQAQSTSVEGQVGEGSSQT